MNYNKFATKIYSTINTKDESTWTKKDHLKVNEIEFILKDEIARDKRAVKYKEKKQSSDVQNTVTTDDSTTFYLNEKEITEENSIVHVGPMSLLHRLTVEQDLEVQQTNEKITISNESVSNMNTVSIGNNESIIKRYFVELTCVQIIKKPPFQIFRINDIVETDFRTDEVTNQRVVYHFYIDTDNVEKIRKSVPEYFIDGSISNITEFENTIPLQYTNIWQNRTKL